MVPLPRVLLLLLLLLLPLCLFGAAADDTTTASIIVTEELERFLQDQVEPGIERYLQWKRKEKKADLIGDDCLHWASGRLLRHRCCVVYSNLAAALLYARYGVMADPNNDNNNADYHEDLKALQDYHSTRKSGFQPQELENIFRMWAVNNPHRKGIYRVPLKIKGVELELFKCEFFDAHTFLTIQSEDFQQPLIVDTSYKQIYLMSIMDEDDLETKQEAAKELSAVLQDRPNFVVFPVDTAPQLFRPDDMKAVLQNANLWNPLVFQNQHPILLHMFAATNMVCGKTSAEILEEQQRLQEQQQQQQRQQQQEQQKRIKRMQELQKLQLEQQQYRARTSDL